ncbi:PEP/pyruvate-binding domain-containing protein [Maridesulfovibrio sp.]|uniref:PEP/pyruvate-binding domain-containing protein n=1 Tax=Maridesulfovibrio sp. TaxID=2795000 RepID=UPI0029CAA0A0|nr:PEP/pyruvate-binding domain-containing protein [Maridesulfovibrio sp.]
MNRLFNSIRSLLKGRHKKRPRSFADLFTSFNSVLELNNRILTGIASMHSKLGGDYIFDIQYLRMASQDMEDLVRKLIDALDSMTPGKYVGLYSSLRQICRNIKKELSGSPVIPNRLMVSFSETTPRDYDLVGAKSYNLARTANLLGIRTPEGISITTRACKEYMEFNGLNDIISAIKHESMNGGKPLDQASKEISDLILAGTIPPEVRKALNAVREQLSSKSEKGMGLAVRSSAWGEDGSYSFAGIYESLINVPPENLHEAYLTVLAAIYSTGAIRYRRRLNYKTRETLMAVSFQTMVNAKCSGVVYTLSPTSPSDNTVIISSAWGLGSSVVGGESATDQFTVSREEPYKQLSISIQRKETALGLNPKGSGTVEENVPGHLQTQSSLTSEEITQLVKTALRMERYFKKPQDIEFAFDHDGSLIILQSRPLQVQSQSYEQSSSLIEELDNREKIISGVGEVAQQGIASGEVFVAQNDASLKDFPDGAILVVKHSSPSFAAILPHAAGLITDVGSPLGHLATIAREYRVPALLNTGNATDVLSTGQIITLDAEQKNIYAGIVQELHIYQAKRENLDETYEYRLLRRILRQIEPLNLFDPSDSNFTPKGCETLHDITRFVHEKAVEELIEINISSSLDLSSPNGKLKLPVPLDMTVIDIGGGLNDIDSGIAAEISKHKTIEQEQVESAPMAAFIEGVTMAGVWQSSPVPVDFSSFMSSMTRTISPELASAPNVGRNLAVISNNYSHISLHLGYHFTIINCFVSDNPADNYVYFRFAGGVTGVQRRSRRAKFLSEVLAHLDFSITVRDDLVIARVKKISADEILYRMKVMGVLVAYTRQLDVSMVDDSQINRYAHDFDKLIANRIQTTIGG